jgi:hypothetical protein
MPDWVQETLVAEDDVKRWLDEQSDLVMIAEINQEFGLREPLHKTAARPWWDLLTWNLALYAKAQRRREAEAARG